MIIHRIDVDMGDESIDMFGEDLLFRRGPPPPPPPGEHGLEKLRREAGAHTRPLFIST